MSKPMSDRTGRPSVLRFGGRGGAFQVDLGSASLSGDQAGALTALFAAGDITRISEEDQRALRAVEIDIGPGGGDAATFIRFDLKIVRIDKAPSLTWEEIEEITLIEEVGFGA